MSNVQNTSARHVYRQKSPLATGAIFGVCAVVLMVSTLMAWRTSPSPLALSWLLLGCALAWTLLVRPSVELDQEGVLLRNIVREVRVPWALVTGVEARWNVKVCIEGRQFTAWAVSSRAQRPRVRPPVAASRPAPGGLAGSRVTAELVAAAIEQTKANYEVSAATGAVRAPADPKARVTWSVPSIALLVVPALAVVAFTVT